MTTFYVFGESPNDTMALAELIKARADVKGRPADVVCLRSPLIHQKGARAITRKTNAGKVAAVIKARIRIRDEGDIVIVAHEDCDQVEPAHTAVVRRIEEGLKNLGRPVIGVAPAFEIEAWWYLWPAAVAAVCSFWKPLTRTNTEVGLIVNAKEILTKDLRPGGRPVRRYSEADAPLIARKIRVLSLIDKKDAKSASFDDFDRKMSALL